MDHAAPATGFAYRPLYAQVRERLVRRLIDGDWQPGQLIPSEMELAREIGVSQGTIRKALDAMTAENLLIRRQGRGTFVARLEESRILFQFFRIEPDSGATAFPSSRILGWRGTKADAETSAALAIAVGADVWHIDRIRSIDGRATMVETLWLPSTRFPGFEDLAEIPNNVYGLYSERWGITIARANETLKAIAASRDDADRLGCAAGTPLLEVRRVALDLEGRPVERRLTRCLTDATHYRAEIG